MKLISPRLISLCIDGALVFAAGDGVASGEGHDQTGGGEVVDQDCYCCGIGGFGIGVEGRAGLCDAPLVELRRGVVGKL